MLAVYANGVNAQHPLSCLVVGDLEVAPAPDGWVKVNVHAAGVNHHDLWTLRGAGVDVSRLPLILGTDAAGVTDDGREVIVHGVIADPHAGGGDETKDPARTLLSEVHPGTFAQSVWVPARNLVDKPAELSWEEAACLPTAWLTAYRMLTTHGHAQPGQTVLIQGSGGGVSTAAVLLGKALGLRVWVTSRDAGKRTWIEQLGADRAFAPGQTLPEPVDLVIETVGDATWQHSLDSVRFGGRVVVAGITSGPMPPANLIAILAKVVTVQGSVMGTAEELDELARLLVATGVRPVIDSVWPAEQAAQALTRMESNELRGKLVLTFEESR